MDTLEPSKEALYSPKWQERFAFYETYGAPKTVTFKKAFKSLPYRKKLLLIRCWPAFFLGPFYLIFALGLKKKGLALLGIGFSISLLELLFQELTGIDVPQALDFGISMAFLFASSMIANYAYYLKEIKNTQSWNPLEGFSAF
ncbi:membrane protein [Pseudomonas asuensis]|uniref:Membrane protein n=1 Tax=Pseudomonas asuensis TaxID=1825787 RepID=A0ABQ2GL97_9PSED|nr:DUF2628 domain-containing protein [Pseudomonas asuensis]GGM00805.1 membrane protein [Pseudomonas asuensis]